MSHRGLVGVGASGQVAYVLLAVWETLGRLWIRPEFGSAARRSRTSRAGPAEVLGRVEL